MGKTFFRHGSFLRVVVVLCLFVSPHVSEAFVYEVGPGQPLANIGDVPWESLSPGDSVFIHYRSQPYHEKWVIDRSGTASNPIIVKGIPGPQGQLPIIDGSGAVTRQKLDFWSEERGIINIGGSNTPNQIPAYIIIEGLDIRNGRPPYWFRDDHGKLKYYSKNATSIYVIEGEHITIRNCILHDCGNGFFACHASGAILVEGCYIYDNGIEGSYYQHNNYTEAKGITFQFNHFGPLRSGCGGNNLKDRSAGTIIRYNWIEGGNRQLDLVDSGYSELVSLPSYRKTYVYGNILIERSDEGNSQIVHYGGDSGETWRYRKGTLYFYNNTVISRRNGNTTLMRLSSQDERCWAANNILYVTAPGYKLALLNRDGSLTLQNNWIKAGWTASHEGTAFRGTILDQGGNLQGDEPGFKDFSSEDYRLNAGSICIDKGEELPSFIPMELRVLEEYVKHQGKRARDANNNIDIGAFEYGLGSSSNHAPVILSFQVDKNVVDNPRSLIRFSGSVSDPDGDSLSYLLDFGDGTKATVLPVEHFYVLKGNYQAVLTVRDGKGGSDTASVSITVNDKIPATPEDVQGEVAK